MFGKKSQNWWLRTRALMETRVSGRARVGRKRPARPRAKESTVKYAVGLLGVLLVPLTALAEEIDAKAADALVAEARKVFQVRGATVALVKEDRVVYLKGHGVRELGGDKPATLEKVASNISGDTSTPKATMVMVEPGVQLEVLDWGGTGETMVLLAGLGDNAHVFDGFAHQFTDRFHVIGITRRGFGRSSQPADGYDVETRARDDIKILDDLHIRRAVFVGHSIAGDELSALGATYPDRVAELVYLDALEYGHPWSRLPQPPSPDYTPTDLSSIERYAAAEARNLGVRKPMSAVCQMLRTDAAGKVIDAISPPGIAKRIVQGSRQAQYDRIKAPALAILVPLSPKNHSVYSPYYADLSRDKQQGFDRCFEELQKWQTDAIQRLRTGVKNSRIVELPDSNHYVFIRDEARVVREMRKFLLE